MSAIAIAIAIVFVAYCSGNSSTVTNIPERPFRTLEISIRKPKLSMVFRDPNTLYRTNHTVGTFACTDRENKRIVLKGGVELKAIRSLGLTQIIILDAAHRFLTGAVIGGEGKWSVEISATDIGNDNGALGIQVFAASHAHNFISTLQADASALATYKQFAISHLPKGSKDIPSLKEQLRRLIIKAAKTPYVSRSIQNAIPTGNNYQTLALEDTVCPGERRTRERFLNQIHFRGKTVLDIGANTGENSRIARRLGAALVDGYEYDPYFVEIGQAINALTGMTRVSLFQGDCTCPALFTGMKYDIVLALAVWVYIKGTIEQISEITDVLVFETHTLDHGIEFYYLPLLEHFPHAISLGYTDMPKDPHKSRMFIVFGKTKEVIERLLARTFLRVTSYFNNPFIQKYNNLSKTEVLDLAQMCFEKHVNRSAYNDRDYQFASRTYFEVFLAGLHQFSKNQGKTKAMVESDNIYCRFLSNGIRSNHIDPKLKELTENSDWMIRKISNKYEDAFNILNGHVDRVAPVEVVRDSNGKLRFITINGEELIAGNIDGHHRFFMCELTGQEKIHFEYFDDSTKVTAQSLGKNMASAYTLEIR